MPNFCMTLSYDGTRYNGWQRQGNTPDTVQGRLETALSALLGQPVEVAGSGRTDAGVHARIRAAGARDLDRLPEQGAERGLEPPLHGVRRVALPLPAVIARAVVAERHAEIRHGIPPVDE